MSGGGGGGGSGINSSGGGGGGHSYADSSISSPVFQDGFNSSTDGSVSVTYTVVDPPLAPVLISPTNGLAVDGAGAGVTFEFQYQPGTDSGSLYEVQLRIAVVGSSYQYWTGSALSGTVTSIAATLVDAPSNTYSVTIPASILTNGNQYQWSIATLEGTLHLLGPFASDYTFFSVTQPTMTFTLPANPCLSATPLVQWTSVTPAGSQTSYRVLAYTDAQTTAPGFAPGSSPNLWDTGVLSGSSLSISVPSPNALPNSTVIHFFGQIVETGALPSQWAELTVTTGFTGPAAPTVGLAVITGVSGANPPGVQINITLPSALGINTTTNVQYLDDLAQGDDGADPVVGTLSNGVVTILAGNTTAQIIDYTVPLGVQRTYYVQLSSGTGTAMVTTNATPAAITHPQVGWWLFDPENTSRVLMLNWESKDGSWDSNSKNPMSIYYPLGRSEMVIVQDVVNQETIKVAFWIKMDGTGNNDWLLFKYMRRTQRPLHLRSSYLKKWWWVILGPDRGWTVDNTQPPLYHIKIDATETAAPSSVV